MLHKKLDCELLIQNTCPVLDAEEIIKQDKRCYWEVISIITG